MTSADNRFAAASKEMRVLVESSAKRLTIVLPRKVGNFFIGPSDARARVSAVFKIERASVFVRSLIDSKWRIIQPPLPVVLHLRHQFQSDEL